MKSVTSSNLYGRAYTVYFDYALMAFGVFYALKNSQLDYIHGFVTILKYLALMSSLLFSMLSILRNYKWNKLNVIIFLSMFLVPLYLRMTYKNNVLASSMLIMAAYNIPFSHIAKTCVRVATITISIVLFFVLFDVIQDRLYDRETDSFGRRNAHDLGFKYYSTVPYLGMGVFQCLIYCWRSRLNILRICFLVFFGYMIFEITYTRLQFYACIMFIVYALLLSYIPKRIFHSKLLASIAIVAYPIICYILYFVSKYMILSIFYADYNELNHAMSGRLGLNEEAFRRYDVTLWGNELELETTIRTKDAYFYIDSGYLHVLLGDGLVWIMIIMVMYMLLTYKIYKARAYYLYGWIMIYSILNISNGFLMNILANPLLLLALSDVKCISTDYYFAPIRQKRKRITFNKYNKSNHFSRVDVNEMVVS